MSIKYLVTLLLAVCFYYPAISQSGLYSIETDYTISNVRVATSGNNQYIVASSHEGTVLAYDYDSTLLWTNVLSGFMNHDIWCEDITGDGNDEILVANADGTIYCLDQNGSTIWQLSANEAPMFSVCVITDNGTSYVVCGGFDLSIYYLSAEGNIVKEIPSSTYSQETTWGDDAAPTGRHLANFIRKINKPDGTEDLVVHGCVNTNSTNGSLYFFEALADLPYHIAEPQNEKPVGDVRVTNYFGNGQEKIFMGSSTARTTTDLSIYNQDNQQVNYVEISTIMNDLGGFGYRVVQTEVIPKGNSYEYFTLIGNHIALIPSNLNLNNIENLECKYAFNDMWLDRTNDRIVLGSAQSGGSCIHVIDYTNPGWKNAFENLSPPGKIQAILDNTQTVRDNLENFTTPDWERAPHPVYFVSDLATNNNDPTILSLAQTIHANYDSPILLGSHFTTNVQNPDDWNRDTMSNEHYRNTRDGRKNYVWTESQVLNNVIPNYNNFVGLSYWGGHGNDPYFYSLKTKKALLDAANGKKTILIYPELQNDTEDFKYVMEDLMYPLATYARTRNTQIHIRTKHVFWQGAAYDSNWRRLASGEFADIFVPSMEETADKSMDLSVAARVGFWAGGAVDQWGTRAVPDNASFNRLRQFSHQKIPNHHLRQVIYAAASGATHFNNFRVDVAYTSLVWELIAKGALYVPKRSELLHINPVHLSMTSHPDPYYLNEGSNTKWVGFYDETREENNKLVFSHLNGTWMGAPVKEWDFSKYAANEKERRLNFIPAYNNGLVMITPVQDGVFALENQPRGKLKNNLHPIYNDILTEYITDGRNYYSADSSQIYPAETYYQTIKTDIENKTSLLPLTVSGDVGWVVAQTDSFHLRLTIVDGGYINPSAKTATVSFHSVTPVSMTDVLDGTTFSVSNPSSVSVDIPCGLFRFIDIEIEEGLQTNTDNPTKNNLTLNLSPNPSSNELHIAFEGIGQTAHLEVVSLLGQVLKRKKVSTTPGQLEAVTLKTNDLPSGTYFLRWPEGKQSKVFVKTN